MTACAQVMGLEAKPSERRLLFVEMLLASSDSVLGSLASLSPAADASPHNASHDTSPSRDAFPPSPPSFGVLPCSEIPDGWPRGLEQRGVIGQGAFSKVLFHLHSFHVWRMTS